MASSLLWAEGRRRQTPQCRFVIFSVSIIIIIVFTIIEIIMMIMTMQPTFIAPWSKSKEIKRARRLEIIMLITMMLISVLQYPKCWTIPIPILFSGIKYFRYRYRYFLRYQIFPIPVPRLFSDTKFDRYRFRDFSPVPNFSDTGSDTTRKMKNSRYRYLYSTGTH